jgi:two-component system sensor histidine kinase KdpD
MKWRLPAVPYHIIAPLPDNVATPDSAGFDSEREGLHRQMLSSVSHDLKTPLVSIIGSLDVLERMKDKLSEEKQTALIRVALQEAYRLDNFITDVLDMAKFENGMVRPKHETTEIGAIIRDCLMRMKNRLHESTVIFDKPNRLEAKTDSSLLCRAISLVLENAVMQGGASPVINISIGAIGDDLGFISIRDSSDGIPDHAQGNLFSKHAEYAKGDRRAKGTGLGLAICKSIMDLLGGEVTAVNDVKGGALFTLGFPIN